MGDRVLFGRVPGCGTFNLLYIAQSPILSPLGLAFRLCSSAYSSFFFSMASLIWVLIISYCLSERWSPVLFVIRVLSSNEEGIGRSRNLSNGDNRILLSNKRGMELCIRATIPVRFTQLWPVVLSRMLYNFRHDFISLSQLALCCS